MKYAWPIVMLYFFISGQACAQTNCTTVTYALASDAKNTPPPNGNGYFETKTFDVSCVNSSTGAASTPNEGSTNSRIGIGQVITKPNCSSNCTVRCDPIWSISITSVGSFAPVVFGNVSEDASSVPQDGQCHYFSPAQTSSTCPAQACASGGGGGTPAPPNHGPCPGGGGGNIAVNGPISYVAGPPGPSPNPPCGNSPIILDVDGKGFALTSAKDGVAFNFNGQQPVQTAWTARGSNNAFLCLPDPNGRCDDGADLFGNFTPQPASDHPNGFAALAVYDLPANGGNGDGVIDARDAIFASLRLWIDRNHDGISQPDELFTLPSLGVNSISLQYHEDPKTDQYGNQFRYRGSVNPGAGNTSSVDRTAYDVFFVVLPSPTSAVLPAAPVSSECKVGAPAPARVLSGAGSKSKK
jgi:hypothetical protein